MEYLTVDEIRERIKKILEAEYYKNNDMKNYLQGLSEKYGEKKYLEIFGINSFVGGNIKQLIEKMDGPNISIEITKEDENVFLVYGLNKEIDEIIVIKLSRRYEFEAIRYYD